MALSELFDAISLSDRRTCEDLLSKGADPNFINRDGISSMHVAAGIEGENAYEILLRLLQHGGEPNLRSCDGFTPVHIASMWGRADCLRLLLQCDGDPSIRDEDGLSAFDHALSCENCNEMIAIIEEHKNGPVYNNSSQSSVESYTFQGTYAGFEKLDNVLDSTPDFEETVTAEQMVSDSEESFYDAFSTLGSTFGDEINKTTNKTGFPGPRGNQLSEVSSKFHNKSFTKSTNTDLSIYSGVIYRDDDNKSNDNNNLYDIEEKPPKSNDDASCRPTTVDKPLQPDAQLFHMGFTGSSEKYCRSQSVPSKVFNRSKSLVEHVDGMMPSEKNVKFSRWSSTIAMPKRRQSQKDITKYEEGKPPKPRKKKTDGLKILAISPPSKIHLRKAFRKHNEQKKNKEKLQDVSFLSDVTQISPAHLDESFDWSYSEVFDPDDSNISSHSGFLEFTNLMSEDNVSYDWKDVSLIEPSDRRNSVVIPKELHDLSNDEIRKRLLDLGETPGPVSALTRNLYLSYLARMLTFGRDANSVMQEFRDYTPEMRSELLGNGTDDVEMRELDRELTRCFDVPDKKWREGGQKTSFNYVLIDPRVTGNLIDRHSLSLKDLFRVFVASVFYVGKGKKARSYEHLTDALKYRNGQGTPSKAGGKIRMIHDIWNAGYGVVSLHLFHSTIPVEALTREALMIDAMGLERLTNVKKGDYYGSASSWSGKQRRQLGVYLLKKAMKILLVEGERQITEENLRK